MPKKPVKGDSFWKPSLTQRVQQCCGEGETLMVDLICGLPLCICTQTVADASNKGPEVGLQGRAFGHALCPGAQNLHQSTEALKKQLHPECKSEGRQF